MIKMDMFVCCIFFYSNYKIKGDILVLCFIKFNVLFNSLGIFCIEIIRIFIYLLELLGMDFLV